MYYTEREINYIINRTRAISSNPNQLYAAYAISCLSEYLVEDGAIDDMWGMEIDIDNLCKLLEDTYLDFTSAMSNNIPITIFGNQYTIRNKNQFASQSAGSIFDFDISNGMALISKGKIRNIELVVEKESTADIRLFFRKIVCLAEDDVNDGWNKLTDMEIVFYCWGMFYYSDLKCDFCSFMSKYSDYIYVNEDEIKKVWSDNCIKSGRLNGIFAFSKRKIEQFNKEHSQKSFVDTISKEQAESYWPKSIIANLKEE